MLNLIKEGIDQLYEQMNSLDPRNPEEKKRRDKIYQEIQVEKQKRDEFYQALRANEMAVQEIKTALNSAPNW